MKAVLSACVAFDKTRKLLLLSENEDGKGKNICRGVAWQKGGKIKLLVMAKFGALGR